MGKKNKYYHKASAREGYWMDIAMRVVLAVIAFFGIMAVGVFSIRRSFGRGVSFGEGNSFLSWQSLIFPAIIAVIVFFSPNALNRWFYNEEEVRLKDVKEMSRRKKS